jgi:hypothetical protein
MKLLSLWYSPSSSYLISFRSKHILRSSAPWSHTIKLWSSLLCESPSFTLIQDKTKIIILCIWIFTLLDSSRDNSVVIATGYGLKIPGSIPGSA